MKRRLVLTVQPELNSGNPLPPRTESQARWLRLADTVLAGKVEGQAATEGKTQPLRRNKRASHKKAA